MSQPSDVVKTFTLWLFCFQAECEYDRVEVYSKIGSDKLRKHGVYCGQEAPSMITSEANALRVEFESDSSVHKTGFAAVFFTGNPRCHSPAWLQCIMVQSRYTPIYSLFRDRLLTSLIPVLLTRTSGRFPTGGKCVTINVLRFSYYRQSSRHSCCFISKQRNRTAMDLVDDMTVVWLANSSDHGFRRKLINYINERETGPKYYNLHCDRGVTVFPHRYI